MPETEPMGDAEAAGGRAGARRKLATGATAVRLPFDAAAAGDGEFARADLIFSGVRHDADSYEVRVFFDNPDATDKTKRTAQAGYAGKFVVFGHGGCFGAEGHCRRDPAPPDPIPALAGLQRGDPTERQEKFITVTEPLRRALAAGTGLNELTLVAIRLAPLAKDEKMDPEVFGFDRVRLETYR
jgi:tyrosinase